LIIGNRDDATDRKIQMNPNLRELPFNGEAPAEESSQ
jgi:hypothetical protein